MRGVARLGGDALVLGLMFRGRRLRVVLPIFAVGLVAVGTGATLGGPIAAAVRHLFAAVTRGSAVALLVAAIAAAVLLPLAARLGSPPGFRVSAPGRLVDRLDWPVAVSILCALAGVLWFSLGRAVTEPLVFADELIHGEAARDLALHGSVATHGYGFVTPAIDSLAYLATTSDVSAYRLVQAMNVVVMVSTAFVAYPLARRAVSARWALVVAALSLILPWLTYARFVLTEPDFYPVFLLFALALVRALEQPTARRQVIVVAALLLTYLTRTQAAALAGAIVCAIPIYGLACPWGSAEGRSGPSPRRGLSTVPGVVIVVLALATGVWSPLGPYRPLIDGLKHPHGLTIWAAANLSSLFLGLGVLVGVGAPLGVAMMLRRSASAGAAAFAAVTVATTAALLTSVSLLSESVYGQGSVHERDLFFAAPLLIACAIAWANNGFPRPRLITTLIVAAVIGLAVLIPAGAITPHSVDALSFKVWSHIHSGGLSPRDWIIAATAAAALAVVVTRSAWPFVLTVLLAAVGVAAASDYRSPGAHAPRQAGTGVDRPRGSKQRPRHAALRRLLASDLRRGRDIAPSRHVALHRILQLANRPRRPPAWRQLVSRSRERAVLAPARRCRHRQRQRDRVGVRRDRRPAPGRRGARRKPRGASRDRRARDGEPHPLAPATGTAAALTAGAGHEAITRSRLRLGRAGADSSG